MISQVRPSFWRAYEKLSPAAKARARMAYQVFAVNPDHPSLRFKKLQGGGDFWSVRINDTVSRGRCAVGRHGAKDLDWHAQ